MTGGVFRKPLQERLNLTAVTGPDLVAQVVEQIEHGQRLLGGPDGRDVDGDGP